MLTLIALSAALLQEPPAPPPPPLPEAGSHFVFVGGDGPGRLDADGDGQVTREEFGAPLNDAFARMDKDGDGRLSAEELASGRGRGDHGVTVLRGPGGPGGGRFEFRRAEDVHDLRVERDGDRTVVFVRGGPGADDEREIILHGVGRGEPDVMRLDGRGGPARIEVRRIGGADGGHDLDKDGDGKVSEAEFTAPLRDAFARMDADRSGFIEEGERGERGDVQVFTHRIERREGGE